MRTGNVRKPRSSSQAANGSAIAPFRIISCSTALPRSVSRPITRARDDVAVTAEELGRAVYHQVTAEFERSEKVGRGPGVVEDGVNAALAGDLRQCRDRRHVAHAGGRAFEVQHPGLGPHGSREIRQDSTPLTNVVWMLKRCRWSSSCLVGQ